MTNNILAFLAAVILLCEVRLLQAAPQQVTTVPDAPSCPSCRLEFSLEVTLGTDAGPGSFVSRPGNVVRDSKGFYYAFAGFNPIQKFDSSGKFVRQIARMGQGPGELRSPVRMLMMPGDTLYVFQAGRHHIYTDDGAFVRSSPHTTPGVWVGRWGDRIVTRGQLTSRVQAGIPFHVLGSGDSVVRSFGQEYLGTELTAAATGFGLWVGWQARYEVVRLDSLGRATQRIRRDPPWFRGEKTWPDQTKPPPSWLHVLHGDSGGLLWVVGRVPGANWRDGVPKMGPDGRANALNFQFDVLHNNIVEVIDPRTGRLVTSAPFAGYIVSFVDDRRVLWPIEDANGIPRAQIWRVTLRRP